MQVSFSSNSSAARDVAAACGMSISSILHNSTGTNVDAAAASDGGSPAAAEVLLPGLSGTATKHRHGAATTAAAAEAAAAALESQLPDPAEAARRIMQELGKYGDSEPQHWGPAQLFWQVSHGHSKPTGVCLVLHQSAVLLQQWQPPHVD